MGNKESVSKTSQERLWACRQFVGVLPHCSTLGMQVIDAVDGGATLLLPYSEAIVGNPDTGVVHGGSITTLMDTACGGAVFNALPGYELCPTLDLRVDYMCMATPGQDLVAHASVSRVTPNVVFVRCRVEQASDNTLIATGQASFMRIDVHIDHLVAQVRGSQVSGSGVGLDDQ